MKNNAQYAMISGSVWMTVGSIVSRILGALYVVPWGIWLGSMFSYANSLFAKGYNIYSLFLIISTAGVPSALAKQIAQLEAKQYHRQARRLVASSLNFMIVLGVIAAVVMWQLAPLLSTQNGKIDLKMVKVVRTLCWSLLVIPPMSVMRGYFQGNSNMGPSAVSQLIEQIARIMYLLVATYYIMCIKNGSYVEAVIQSTFAAFVGAVFSFLYLIWRTGTIMRYPFHKLLKGFTNTKILLVLLYQAIPFIILDGAIVLYQFIDQYTFPILMRWQFRINNNEINYLYGLFGFNSNKLTMIVVSLATAMAVTAIPVLSKLFVESDQYKLTQQIVMIFKLYFFIMLPSAFGMFALARPLYRVFYLRFDKIGIQILMINIFVAIIVGLFIVLVSILQSVFHSKRAVFYFAIGLLIKIIVQIFAVFFLGVYGPLIATAVGLGSSSILMILDLYRTFHFKLLSLIKFLFKDLMVAVFMMVFVFIWYKFSNMVFPNTFFINCVFVIVGALIGIMLYGYICLILRIADGALGMNLAKLRKMLYIP